jgi:hypothetical protein
MRLAEIRFFRNSIRSRLGFCSPLFSLAPDFGAEHAHLGGDRRFCANFLKVLKRSRHVKPENRVKILIPISFQSGFPGSSHSGSRETKRLLRPIRAAQILKEQPAKCPHPPAADAQKPELLGLRMACSL